MDATARDMVAKLLRSADIDREQCLRAGLVRGRAVRAGGKPRAPRASEIDACLRWLTAELEVARPRVIIALGKLPAAALLGARPYSSLVLSAVLNLPHRAPQLPDTPWVVPIRPPEQLLRGNHGQVLAAVDVLKWSKALAT